MILKELGERHYDDTLQSIWDFHRLLTEKQIPPSYSGRDRLLETAIKICQMMADSLKAELASTSGSSDFDIFSLCARYRALLRLLQSQVLDFVANVDLTDIPLEIVEPLEISIREFEQDFALILRCYSQENYQLTAYQNLYESYFATLSPYVPTAYRSCPSSPEWLVFISFPRIYAKNVLLHCITFSHELLHLRDHVEGISERLLAEIQLSKSDISGLVQQIGTTLVFPEKPLLPPIRIEEVRGREEIEREVLETCSEILENWLKELVADALAIRLFGPAFFFSLARLSLSLGAMDQHSDTHPCSRLRLRLMLRELHRMRYLAKTKKGQVIVGELQKWESFLAEEVTARQTPYHQIAESKVMMASETLQKKVREATSKQSYKAVTFRAEVWRLVELLDNGISPVEVKDVNRRIVKPASIVSIQNAGYAFYLAHIDRLGQLLGIADESDSRIVDTLGKLLLHAIQASTIWKRWLNLQGKEHVEAEKRKEHSVRREMRATAVQDGSAPCEESLVTQIFNPRVAEQLVVTPCFGILPQDCTIDVHLGTKFLLFRLTRFPEIDPSTLTEQQARELLDTFQLRLDQQLNLHPGQLLLASTLEYLSMPSNLGASVVTRSTYGRMGLVTATSIYVHPGFKGCLTLELVNIGNSPIVLRPCDRVAQLVFTYHTPSGLPSTTKYLLATEPQFPKVWKERDRDLLNKLRSTNSDANLS